MENTKSPETGFRIEKILLLESSFSRVNNVIFGKEVNNDTHIHVDVNVKESVIIVNETVSFSQKYQDDEQVAIKVRMVGTFNVVGVTEITDYEGFGRINGAAIIFPYIREHVTNLSIKAGLGAIILPPVNFTAIQGE